MPPAIGAHVSVAGGVSTALTRGEAIGCDAIQVFVKNANRWQGKPLGDEEVARFRQAHQASPIGPVVAHASYLINLAAQNRETLEKSRAALVDELSRCARLGIPDVVVHPGAHLGAGEAEGIKRAAASLDAVLACAPGDTRVLLENTAGQGTVLGERLEHLAAILEATRHAGHLGVCFDTAHAFAAGYPIHQADGQEAFLANVEATVGLGRVGCVHLNDSVFGLGARKDRHANIGAGELGLAPFAWLLQDARLQGVPMVVETPLGDDQLGHARDVARLRALAHTTT